MTSSGGFCQYKDRMSSTDGALFSELMVLLFLVLLGLRVRFPRASQRAETAVMTVTTVLFFSLCYIFLHN
jgi:hypothetical protein